MNFKIGDTVRRYRGGINDGVREGDTFVILDINPKNNMIQGGPNATTTTSGWHNHYNLELVESRVINTYPIY